MEAIRKDPAAETASAPKLEARDLHKAFGPKVVLDGISFSVAAGESLVIVGPSGTGKSVLLKHLIGLIRPDSGAVLVDGQDFWQLDAIAQSQVRKKFGMSFRPSCREECGGAWVSRARSPTSPRSCSLTSRIRAWIPS
jgi:ABC-type bacteriocin/lantibiotic exporter with double-glycine peptidase domain